MELILLVIIITLIGAVVAIIFLKIPKQSSREVTDQLRDIQTNIDRFTYQGERMLDQVQNIELKVTERLGYFENAILKDQQEFQIRFSQQISQDFRSLNERIETRLDVMNERVEERLSQSLNKTNETFQNILSRLVVIDEAQKKIDSLSTNIVSLQEILSDKKARGMFGEAQLHQLLVSVFGERRGHLYDEQIKLSNGTIADAVVFAPEPTGQIAIDSKFPLENYRRLTDMNLSTIERETFAKAFKTDVKKHIDAIASKYIIIGETSDSAILFLPAEAIFSYIHAYCEDIIEYANRKSIWLTSPTTLFATLTTLQIVMKNLEREKYALVIQSEINKLSDEFSRYQIRWTKLTNDLDKVSKDVKDINTTSTKIERRFKEIAAVEFSNETIEKVKEISL